METTNATLMKSARESLKGKWGLAIGTCLAYILIPQAIQRIPVPIPLGGFIISFLVSAPLAMGLAVFTLSIARNENAKLEQLFDGLNNYKTSLKAYFLQRLIVFLCLLLFVIPGIIVAIGYSMTFYIIADDRTIGASAAMDKSTKMMDGHKWKYFCLIIRLYLLAFIAGLAIIYLLLQKSIYGLMFDNLAISLPLVLILGGIASLGFLWLFPYVKVSCAKFYEDLKRQAVTVDTK